MISPRQPALILPLPINVDVSLATIGILSTISASALTLLQSLPLVVPASAASALRDLMAHVSAPLHVGAWEQTNGTLSPINVTVIPLLASWSTEFARPAQPSREPLNLLKTVNVCAIQEESGRVTVVSALLVQNAPVELETSSCPVENVFPVRALREPTGFQPVQGNASAILALSGRTSVQLALVALPM